MAKKKAKRKVASAAAARKVAKQKPAAKQKPVVQQDLIKDAFPERNDQLEELANRLAKLNDQCQKANEKRTASKDEIAQAMIDAGLERYKCYTIRKELVRNVASVKARTVPEKEATPYQPA